MRNHRGVDWEASPRLQITMMSGRKVLTVATLLCSLAREGSAQATTAARGQVRGTVWDSTRAAPLRRSVVQMVHAEGLAPPRSVVTDSAGRFQLDSVEAGVWIVAAQHSRMDTLAVDELALRVSVVAGGVTRPTLALPSTITLSRQMCRDQYRDSTGYLSGRLRRADGNRDPVPGAVRITWTELALNDGRLERQSVSAVASTSPSGQYLVCGIPATTQAVVQGWNGIDSTGVIDIAFGTAPIGRLDLFVGRTQYVQQTLDSTAVGDSLATTVVRRGEGRVTGVVTDSGSTPIAGAVVAIVGNGQTQRTAQTGRFDLVGVATGTQLLDVRAVGFQPLRIPVNVLENEAPITTFSMSKVMTLSKVEIRAFRAIAMGPDMIDFEHRRKVGTGRYFGPEDMIALDPLRIATLMERVPGVRVAQNGISGDRILMRGVGFSQYCTPDIWLDGYRVSNDGTMDSFVQPQQIRAVEIYSRAASVPPQFSTVSGCGVVVLWSGPRTPTGAVRR